MIYQIEIEGRFGSVYARLPDGGLRLVCGIQRDCGYTTLRRTETIGTVLAAEGRLGWSHVKHTEEIRIHEVGPEAIGIADRVLTRWARERLAS